jgi:bacterioferritin (cytochrome b1)
MATYHDVANRIAGKSHVALTPELEGDYSTDKEGLCVLLMDIMHCKYAIYIAYTNFADRLRGPYRDAVVEHWQDHAKEEKQAAYDIAMKLFGLGCDPTVRCIEIPECGNEVGEMAKCLANMELDLINKSRALCSLSGENTAMRVLGENIVLTDTQHLDDLRRMSYEFVG